MTDALGRLSAALADRYCLERELGQGGMAAVYLARDLRHDREVAIKVLHPDLGAALGADRFLSEIKTTARLQHPHILPLLDSGTADGLLFYVMPFVSGETLRARLARERQLAVDEAMLIAREVSDALGYAHGLGIIHRDIKPENILLQGGHALVADFGIALALQQAGGARMTQTGLSLGTPAYMSPEQASAEKQLDGRSDQYSLAAVVYEMLAGEPPFTGPTAAAVMAHLMTERPRPLDERRPTVPRGVVDAVARAMEKIPADRFPTCADFARALVQPSAGGVAPAVGHRGAGWRPIAAVVAFAGAIAGGWWAGRSARPAAMPAGPPSRMALLVPPEHPIAGSLTDRVITVSADGREVIYHAATSATDPMSRLYRQRLDADTAEAIPNSELLTVPSLSPDGAWLAAVNRTSALVLLPTRGGSADLRPIAPGPLPQAAWHPDGSLYFTHGTYRDVRRVDPRTRAITTVTKVPAPGVWIEQILPDGRRALVVIAGGSTSTGRCAILDLTRGSLSPVLDLAVSSVRWSAGYLVARRGDGVLLAFPFDLARGTTTGDGVAVARSVGTVGAAGQSQFDASPAGVMVYGELPPPSLVMVDRSGRAASLSEVRGEWHNPRLSPDGNLLAADRLSADGRDVWVMNLARQTLTRVTVARAGHDAVWSPDGRSLVFLSDESGVLGIRRAAVGASAVAESLYTGPLTGAPTGWLPDGRTLLISGVRSAEGGLDVLAVRNSGAGPVEPLVATAANELSATVSPDGHWLAFVSERTGRSEVYVRPLARTAAEVAVSLDGGSEPVWSREGKELFYRGTTDRGTWLVAARMETGPAFRVAERTPLFSVTGYLPSYPHSNFDVTPDGRHFVFVQGYEITRIAVVQNLPALVRQLSGARP